MDGFYKKWSSWDLWYLINSVCNLFWMSWGSITSLLLLLVLKKRKKNNLIKLLPGRNIWDIIEILFVIVLPYGTWSFSPEQLHVRVSENILTHIPVLGSRCISGREVPGCPCWWRWSFRYNLVAIWQHAACASSETGRTNHMLDTRCISDVMTPYVKKTLIFPVHSYFSTSVTLERDEQGNQHSLFDSQLLIYS